MKGRDDMSDLIDREAVMEIILMPQNVSIIEQLEMLKKLPSASQWIPVTERLPEKGGWYLVTWEDPFKIVRRVAASEFIEPKGLTDIGHFEGFVLREIIAWMPLPEPYKKDGEPNG